MIVHTHTGHAMHSHITSGIYVLPTSIQFCVPEYIDEGRYLPAGSVFKKYEMS